MLTSISEDIQKCKKCNHFSETPFFFNLNKQEIMIITGAPSLQATYKPLPSIRFFRHLCIALFGDKYLREPELCEKYLQEFCDGNIYWTHYHKCFSPDYSNNLSMIDDNCAKEFLLREINFLKPKIIIVFGNEIKEKVSKFIGNTSTVCIYKHFPKSGFESEYSDLQKEIRKYLKYVHKTGVSNNAEKIDLSNDLRGHEVHLLFERDAFVKMYEGQTIDTSTGNIDDIWYKNLIVPNMERCAKLVSAYSFCENQIKVFLYDYFSRNDDYTILRKFRNFSAAKAPSKKEVFGEIGEKWNNSIQDYVDYLVFKGTDYKMTNELKDKVIRVCKEMRYIKDIRNAIVHNGGLLDSKSMINSDTKVKGIYNFAGSIYISKKGEEAIEKLVNEVTDMLCSISNNY